MSKPAFEARHYDAVFNEIACYAEILRDHLNALTQGDGEDMTPDTHRKFMGLAILIGALADQMRTDRPALGNVASWAIGDEVERVDDPAGALA